jgi:hypothetical protein
MPHSPVLARQWIADLTMLARLTRDMPAFLRRPLTLEEARARIQCNLERRDERFATVVENQIYGYSRSPYLALLRNAGCELGDVLALIRREGIEGTLNYLAHRGVYVTFDELKGRRAAVRGSSRLTFHDRDFDNPAVPVHYALPTGGTRGLPTLVGRSLEYVAEKATSRAVSSEAHGLRGAGYVFWLTGPIGQFMTYSKLGHPIVAWFHPVAPLPRTVRLGGDYLRSVGLLAGRRFPRPVHVDLQAPQRLVADLVRRTSSGRRIVVVSPTSSAVRISAAARAAGTQLEHVTFHAQGEPMTPARRAHIEACGAATLPTYGMVESSSIGHGCAAPEAADDMHLFEDLFSVVTRRREATPGGPNVDALLVTTLSPLAEKILFNTETGDCAELTQRNCGCSMGTMGLRTHLSNIRSFEKLSGEGMTMFGSSLVQILEETLPDRFGGSSVDYQLLEEEGVDSATRLTLRVHPSIGPIVETEVRETLLRGIARANAMNAHMVRIWDLAETVRISREPPLATSAGKVLPFHLAKALPDA